MPVIGKFVVGPHALLEAALQVILVHPVPDDDDRAVRLKPVVDRAVEPVPHLGPNCLRLGVGHGAKRVVDQPSVRAAAHHVAADPNRVPGAALGGVPRPCCLAQAWCSDK